MRFENTCFESIEQENIGCQAPGSAEQSGAVPGAVLLREEQGLTPCTCLRGYESQDIKSSVLEREHKAKVFYVRLVEGILVAQELGYPVRWFTLTESDYALGMGLDFGGAINKLNGKLRHDYGVLGYAWVEHLQGDKERRNRHLIEWGKAKLNPQELDDYWLKIYGSKVTGLAAVKHAKKAAHYLSQYVAGEGFQRARFSNNWIFSGSFEFSRWVKRSLGYYPDIETLAKLSVMSPVERLVVPEWRGYAVSKQGAVKQKLADDVLGVPEREAEWLRAYKRRKHSVGAGKIKLEPETLELWRGKLERDRKERESVGV